MFEQQPSLGQRLAFFPTIPETLESLADLAHVSPTFVGHEDPLRNCAGLHPWVQGAPRLGPASSGLHSSLHVLLTTSLSSPLPMLSMACAPSIEYNGQGTDIQGHSGEACTHPPRGFHQ